MTTGEQQTSSTREDEFLGRLYAQVTERQAAGFGAGYDMPAGTDRLRAWLQEHAAPDQARLEPAQAARPAARRASPGVASAAAAAVGPGEILIAATAARGPRADRGKMTESAADRDADKRVTALYETHYRSLVRLAALLVRDTATAEEMVQDSFAALHSAWRTRGIDSALSYLRQSVVIRSRSVLRHRAADTGAPEPSPGWARTEPHAKSGLEHPAVIAALRGLPPRQREALVLRYYTNLSEAQIATAMGISRHAVKTHLARAMTALRTVLDHTEE